MSVSPSIALTTVNGGVSVMTVVPEGLFIAGAFTTYGTTVTAGSAIVDPTTGALIR